MTGTAPDRTSNLCTGRDRRRVGVRAARNPFNSLPEFRDEKDIAVAAVADDREVADANVSGELRGQQFGAAMVEPSFARGDALRSTDKVSDPSRLRRVP